MIHENDNGRFIIASNEQNKPHEAPTLLLAQIIAEAQVQLAKPGADTTRSAKVLTILAEAAVMNTAWCVSNPCQKLDRLRYTHLAETDKGRWALSSKPFPAFDTKRPGLICEAELSPEQLAKTCFITDKMTATFLATAMSHRFGDQTGPHAYFSRNATGQIFCRHEQGLPLGAMNDLPEREQAIHLQAAELQLLLAKTYRNVANLIAKNTT